jgi:O-methyltransferase
MLLRVGRILALVVAAVGIFYLGYSLAAERRVVNETRVTYEPTTCNCSPNCRVSGPNGLYLDLMKLSLTDLLYETNPQARANLAEGRTTPSRGLTMVGARRLENLQDLMGRTLSENIPGDYLEAGAWRGGACIFMRAVLEAHGVTDRKVWVADSFEGLPDVGPGKQPPGSAGLMAVSLEEVQDSFRRYGLLDGQVQFLKGWFKDTFPKAPIARLAILRVDADLYDSTMDALVNLYDRVSPGGFVIIDDTAFEFCAKAVNDFRQQRGITAPLQKIDWTGVYWQKPRV